MTRDEVMALTDEELRVKAAEILGFRWHKNLNGRRFMGVPDEGGCIAAESTVAVALDALRLVPDYPRDIAAAFELVEKMTEDGDCLSIIKTFGGGNWNVELFREWDSDESEFTVQTVQGDTAPLAITRAFVIAMSNEAH